MSDSKDIIKSTDDIDLSDDTEIEYPEEEVVPIVCEDNGVEKELTKEEREELYYDMLRAEYEYDFRNFSENDIIDIPKNETVLCVYYSNNTENKDRNFIDFINGNKKEARFQKTTPKYFRLLTIISSKIMVKSNEIQ